MAGATNGNRPVTNRELNDKIDLLRAEDKLAHFKTRALTPVFAFLGAAAGKAISPVIAAYVVWPF